jgi:hypothetical protein
MPRHLLLALISFLFSATLYGQEAKKPSPAVTRILDDAVRAVRKNRHDFDKANETPLGEARKALEELSTKLIRDGKAEEATAVLKQVGTLEADVMKMVNASAPIAGGGAVGVQKPLLERLEGKWGGPKSKFYYRFEGNGRASLHRSSDGAVDVRGVWEVAGPEKAVVKWDHGFVDTLHLAGSDVVALLGNKGARLVLERVQ